MAYREPANFDSLFGKQYDAESLVPEKVINLNSLAIKQVDLNSLFPKQVDLDSIPEVEEVLP